MQKGQGTLFICATPIGNLDDVSFRLIDTLKTSGTIVAEDTRTLRKLLLRFGIKKPISSIISYQDYSSRIKTDSIINILKNGSDIALVSESGTPAIQDPGYKIIRECIGNGINVSIIPGPNAAICALVISGLATDSFLFVGFLPKKPSKISEKIKSLQHLPFTIVFYESPLRILKLLEMLLAIFGDRKCCIAREMTKIYEEAIRGSLAEVIDELKNRQSGGKKLKGEMVLVVEGYHEKPATGYSREDIVKEFREIISSNISRKEALKILRSRYDIDRNLLYKITIKNK